MLLYKMILAISWSKFHQIITKWISLESTWKGLLKNVKDGNSRPLGSWEIQKTKAGTVLVDTLYIAIKQQNNRQFNKVGRSVQILSQAEQ